MESSEVLLPLRMFNSAEFDSFGRVDCENSNFFKLAEVPFPWTYADASPGCSEKCR